MRLLILGGTGFLGRHLVETGLTRGYQITLFNRGRRNPQLYPQVEHLHGDRDGDLAALRGHTWDVVIDCSGYVPRIVRDSAELLSDQVEHYTFISSISVYKDFSQRGVNEDSPLDTIADETSEEVTGESYGPLKALCERAAERVMPGRVLNVRPGLIVGPYDPTDRFTYWIRRVASGGRILAPGNPNQEVQFIDGRDLAEWCLNMAAQRQTGVFNATGPATPLGMGEFLQRCIDVSNSTAELTWLDESFLLQAAAQPWSELPLWVPAETDTSYTGFSAVDCRRAISAGLRFRPSEIIIRDTLEWDRSRPIDQPLRAGLSPEREQELLAAWDRRS